MKNFILAGVAALLCLSCNVQKYQVRRLDALSLQQPSEFLRLSDLLNPCFSGKAKSDTVIIAGKTDTIVKPGAPVITRRNDTVFSTLHDTLYVHKTVIQSIHDTVPDSRGLASAEARIEDCSAQKIAAVTQLSDSQATAKTRLYWIIGLAALIGITVVIKVYSLFSGGALSKL
jgi:uncharacterized membrane protein YuzA (DUF378 family)